MVEEKRTVWVYWKVNRSFYAVANKKEITEPARIISSAITAVNKMVAQGDEQKALMSEIIGLSSSSPDWDKQIRLYWNSLSEPIPETGRELNIGFKYDIADPNKKEQIEALNKRLNPTSAKGKEISKDEHLLDYFSHKLSVLSDKFNTTITDSAKISHAPTREKAIDQAYKNKIEGTLNLEQEKFKYGIPLEVTDYMLYRYCLVYNAVANEFDLANKSKNIRFYLHSEEDKNRLAKLELAKEHSRMEAYLKVIKNMDTVDNVLYAFGKGEKLIKAGPTDRHIMLDKLSKSNIDKFISVSNDKHLKTVALIEKYIIYNIFKRLEGSTVIVDADNPAAIIGNDIVEAVSYFANDDNKKNIIEYKAKLSGLPLE